MLAQSKEVQEAWRATQRTLDIKVLVDGKEYKATDINSLKYDSGAYSGDTFAIGSTYSNNVQIEFSHLIEGLKLGMEVRPSIGIKTSSGYVYEPLGVFIISSEIKMDRNNNLTTVSASDRFCGLEGSYVSKLTYPAKVLDVIAEICAQSGVKANANDLARLPHQEDLTAPITGQSYRKALGWIAQLYVGYALFDRQGLFTIRTISEPNYELDPSQYEQAGLDKNEAAYKINGIQCQVTTITKTRDGESAEETKTYQAGNATGSQIKLENNIMTQQRLDNIWEQLKDLTFYPYSLNWFGNPAVEAGDWLRLQDKQGNSFVVPNSGYTLDFNGGLSATSKADQTTSSDQMVSWQGSVSQAIKELQARRAPDGTVIFPPSVTEPPANAKFNDVWFKKNGNSTELWIFEKQNDGSGKWVRKDLTNDEIKEKVAAAQQGLSKVEADIITNKQKADADIEDLNKSIADNKKAADADIESLNRSIDDNKRAADADIAKLTQSIIGNKAIADDSLQKLHDSVNNLEGQYKNNIVPDLNKVTADVADALQKYATAQQNIADLTKQAQSQGKDIADVTNTVKGLNINYADLAGDVNSTKVDVKSLQTTLGTANGDIAQLKLDAQSLQALLAGKVDSATYTNFVDLTNKALAAKLTAGDLAGYAKTVDVQATANGLKMNIDSVNGRLDNLKIGTNNLLHHSKTFEGWWKGATVTISSDEYLNGRIAVLGNAGVNSSQIVTDLDGPYDDQSVTWTLYAKADNAGDKFHTELWGGGGITDQPLTTEWKLYKFSGKRDARNHGFYLWGCQGNQGNVYVALPYAVVGNTIGTWLPNPEDIDEDITQLSARITANSQQFSSYYTKSETDSKTDTAKNDAVNAIKNDVNWTGLTNIITNSGFLQTAGGFTQMVQQTTQPLIDANNGGGVNLLQRTNFEKETIKNLQNSWGSQFTLRDGIAMQLDALDKTAYVDALQLVRVEPNTDYTLSFEVKYSELSSGGNWNSIQTFMVERKDKSTNTDVYMDHVRSVINTSNRADNIYTIHTQNDCHYLQVIFRANPKTLFSFINPKLERGRVSTPYSQAPSDNVTQVAFTKLTQTVEGLQSTVSGNYNTLQTQISQTATAVRGELSNQIAGVTNQITATANSFNVSLNSLRSETAWQTITTAIDANDYTTTGNYWIQATPNINTPDGSAWAYLRVVAYPAVKRVMQTWQRDNNPDEAYTRLFITDKWSDWRRAASYAEYSSLNQTVQGLQSTVSSNYNALQSQISQTATAVRGELSNQITGVTNQITATADGLNARIEAIRIGGRNLIQGTSNQWIKCTEIWGADHYIDTAKWQPGDTLTMSAEVRNCSAKTYADFYSTVNSKNVDLGLTDSEIAPIDSSGKVYRIKTTITIPEGTTKISATITGRPQPSNFEYRKLKVEKGNQATDWTSAPEDIEQQFTELNATINGLQSTVSGNYNTLQTKISQTATAIRGELTNSISGLQTKITANSNGLNSAVGRVDSLETLTSMQVVGKAIDANAYTNTGNYFVKSSASTNVPMTSWFYLEVKKASDGRIIQTWQADNEPAYRYVRTYNGTWSGWKRPASYAEYSNLSQTVQGLQSTISGNYNALTNQISQTNQTTRDEINDKVKGLQGQLTLQSNNFNVSLNSLRNETAWQTVTSPINADSMQTTGNYWIQATPNTNTPDNGAWAYLRVVAYPAVKRVLQVWQRDNDENQSYTRLFVTDKWTAWQKNVTSGNILAQINMSADATLIKNSKIYMDASSTIFSGNAFIPSAAITSLNADKINAGTINGAKVNVINLNANNITAGTLKGSNGEFFLDSGSLHVWQDDHNTWIDKNGVHDYENGNDTWIQQGQLAVTNSNNEGFFSKNGNIELTSRELWGAGQPAKYGTIKLGQNLFNAGGTGMEIIGHDGFFIHSENYSGDDGLLLRSGKQVTGAAIGGNNGNLVAKAHNLIELRAGNLVSPGKPFSPVQPYIDIGANANFDEIDMFSSQLRWSGPDSEQSLYFLKDNKSFDVYASPITYISINDKTSYTEGLFNVALHGQNVLTSTSSSTTIGSKGLYVKDFYASGSKNAIVPTSRGMAAINAYETAEYYFGDIGETQTDANGVVRVMIDPLFLETVNTLVPYQVFLTAYGDANVWIDSRSANSFIVKSSKPNIHFAWEMKAKRKGYENDRMKIVKGVFNNE